MSTAEGLNGGLPDDKCLGIIPPDRRSLCARACRHHITRMEPDQKPAPTTQPEDLKPFRMGDPVVYPSHGVGKIDWIGFEQIAGQRLQVIRISFEDNRMTLRVPVAKARQTGLRNLANRAQLDKGCSGAERPRACQPGRMGPSHARPDGEDKLR